MRQVAIQLLSLSIHTEKNYLQKTAQFLGFCSVKSIVLIIKESTLANYSSSI